MDYIGKVPVCEPIKSVLQTLSQKGCTVLSSEVGDYHFHELRFKITGINEDDFKLAISDIMQISLIEKNFCACDCHWSTIKNT